MYYQIRNWLEGTYTLRIITDFFDLLWKIGPYLILSIVLNVGVIRYFKTKKISFSTKNEYFGIVFAAIVGLASPLPTYAAIPIGLSLLATGVPFSVMLAFILASPLMNPTIFFLTATQIGMEMAIARTIAAFILSLIGGFLSAFLFKPIIHIDPEKIFLPDQVQKPLLHDIYHNSLYIIKFFSLALLLSAAVRALVPPEIITQLLAGNAKVSTLIAIGMGVPFYTCGGSAIPFIETLMNLGMSKGAVLAFFIAGPATKLETLYAYKTLLGTRVLIFFLIITTVFAYIAGVLYSLF